MESIKVLVRNLAVIMILASFLQMLLPNQSMRGFVKLIMGLFVISATLNPVTALLRLPLEMNIPAWTEVASRDMPVLAGNTGIQAGKDAVQEQFKLILKNQIEALVLGISGIKQVDVNISLTDSTGGFTDQPRVVRVDIRINSVDGEIQSVKPVRIGEKESEETGIETVPNQAQEIKDKVAAFLQIPQDKIFVSGKS